MERASDVQHLYCRSGDMKLKHSSFCFTKLYAIEPDQIQWRGGWNHMPLKQWCTLDEKNKR